MFDDSIEEVVRQYSPQLMSMPHIVGVGHGRAHNRPCVTVYVSSLSPELEEMIPHTLKGYEVILENTGDIVSL